MTDADASNKQIISLHWSIVNESYNVIRMGGDKRDNLSQDCLDSDPPRHVLMELTQLRVTLSPSRPPLCRESVCYFVS